MALRIGELARRTGVGVSTLRAWESRFRFLEPQRSPSGQREYLEADVERVEAVLRLMAEGLTLPAAIARVSTGGPAALPTGQGEELLFGRILQVIDQGVWVSREGRTRYANRRMAELMRCSLDTLLTQPVLDFQSPDDLPLTRERGAQVRAGLDLHCTQELRRADGSTFLAEIDATPLINQSGQYEGSVALVTDITARTEAEKGARFRAALLDAVGEALTASDLDGSLVYANAAAERLFGWRASEVLGRDGRKLMAAPEDSEEADEIHARLLAGHRYSGNLRLTRRDRSQFVASLTSSPVFDETGEAVGLMAVIADQTDRMKIDRDRRVMELQLETLATLSSRALSSQAKPRSMTLMLNETIEATRRILEADHVTVLSVVDGKDDLDILASSPPNREATVVPSGSRSLAGYVALVGKVVVVGNAKDDPRFEHRGAVPGSWPTSFVGAPILGSRGIRGVLTAESSVSDQFDDGAGHFLQAMATVVAITLPVE